MAKAIALTGALGSILVAGIARAQVDMALEHEAYMDDLRMAAIRGHNVITPKGHIVFDPPFKGLPPDENGVYNAEFKMGHGVVIEINRQADVYASAADLISPLPDRLSVNPDSPHFGEYGKIGVRFDGSDRPGDVEEYCVSGGWIRVRTFMANGKPKRERGKFVCLTRHGTVEPYRK